MKKFLIRIVGMLFALAMLIGVSTTNAIQAEAFTAQGPFWSGTSTWNPCWPLDCTYDFKGYIQEYSDGHVTVADVYRFDHGSCLPGMHANVQLYDPILGHAIGSGSWGVMACSSSWYSVKYNYGPTGLTYNHPYESDSYLNVDNTWGPDNFTPRLYWK